MRLFHNKDFVHFHVHGEHSKFDGLCSLQKLVNKAREMGFPAIALTDHGNMQGAIQFLRLCRAEKDKKGNEIGYPIIKPIVGSEFYMGRKMDIGQYDEKKKKQGIPKQNQPDGQRGNRHLNLFAMNFQGYKNLCSLSQLSFTDGFYSSPRIDLEIIDKYSEGIMGSSACLSNIINVNLRYGRYKEAKKACGVFNEIFKGNFFLEVMYHGIPEEKEIITDIFKLSRELSIPVVATNDVHYLEKQDFDTHELLLAMSQKRCLKDPKRLSFVHKEFYLKSAQEMAEIFGSHPECIFNSVRIAERINTKDIEDNLFGGMRLPKFDIPEEYKTPYDYMKKLAQDGMKRIGWDKSPKHIEAFNKELADVRVAKENNNYDFATYFLIVMDYVNFARDHDILVGAGRGSGAASVLLRCLDITRTVDPIKFSLLWERFLAFKTDENGKRVFARATFPDIDVDFSDDLRGKVYEYIINKYGRENVGNIGIFGTMQFKSTIARVTKALDIADSFHKSSEAYISDNAAKTTEILESFPKGGVIKIRDKEDSKTYFIKTVQDAYDHSPDFKYFMDKYPDIKKHAEKIEGIFANTSVHAGGIVISDVPLKEIAPLRLAKGGRLATQFTDLESLGLIKFDILGISGLTVVKNTVKLIKKNYDLDIDIYNLPFDDYKTLELYRKGNLGGVFQCEQWGMQKTMRDIGVDNFSDIIAAISLYRPGPMDFIPSYCDRKKGEEPVSYFHSSIEPFVKEHLKETYGVMTYQEQLMQVCNSLAGFNIADGYIMIKAIGKKLKNLMKDFEKQFISGCIKNKVTGEVAKQYWDKVITPFAGYGFNKSHAVVYGINSFISAYLKSNYPDEFITSLLNVIVTSTGGEKYDKILSFEKEFKRKMNIKFLERNINNSKLHYTIEKKSTCSTEKTEIRPSLLCKGIGVDAVMEIEKNQPFKNMVEFVNKVDTSIVTTRAVSALASEGYWGNKAKKSPEKVVKEFLMIREDIKRVQSKGIESNDIFG